MKNFGLDIKRARLKKGIDLRKVSEQTDISIATLSRIEDGNDCYAANFLILCRYFKLNANRYKPDNKEPEIDRECEIIYQKYWKPLLETDGIIDRKQLKRELFDFHNLINNASAVFSYVTGGAVSKVLTKAETVNSLADEHYTEIYESRVLGK